MGNFRVPKKIRKNKRNLKLFKMRRLINRQGDKGLNRKYSEVIKWPSNPYEMLRFIITGREWPYKNLWSYKSEAWYDLDFRELDPRGIEYVAVHTRFPHMGELITWLHEYGADIYLSPSPRGHPFHYLRTRWRKTRKPLPKCPSFLEVVQGELKPYCEN